MNNYITDFEKEYKDILKTFEEVKKDDEKTEEEKKRINAENLLKLAILKQKYNRYKKVFETESDEFGNKISGNTKKEIKKFLKHFKEFDKENSKINKIITPELYNLAESYKDDEKKSFYKAIDMSKKELTSDQVKYINENYKDKKKNDVFYGLASDKIKNQYKEELNRYKESYITSILNLENIEDNMKAAANFNKKKRRFKKIKATCAVVGLAILTAFGLKSCDNNHKRVNHSIESIKDNDSRTNSNNYTNTNADNSSSNTYSSDDSKTSTNTLGTTDESKNNSDSNNKSNNLNNSTNSKDNKNSTSSNNSSNNNNSNSNNNSGNNNQGTTPSGNQGNKSTYEDNTPSGIDLDEDAKNNGDITITGDLGDTVMPSYDNVEGNDLTNNNPDLTEISTPVDPSVNDPDHQNKTTNNDSSKEQAEKDAGNKVDESGSSDEEKFNPSLKTEADEINSSVNDPDHQDKTTIEESEIVIPGYIEEDEITDDKKSDDNKQNITNDKKSENTEKKSDDSKNNNTINTDDYEIDDFGDYEVVNDVTKTANEIAEQAVTKKYDSNIQAINYKLSADSYAEFKEDENGLISVNVYTPQEAPVKTLRLR